MPADAATARARAALYRSLRQSLDARGYLEVETPCLVPFAGQEPHLLPFEATFTPELPVPEGAVSGARRLYLHTSPEYAMKRLLAREGFSRCYQLARVFRDGEVSLSHNPEFTLLEFYASPGDAALIMGDLEAIVAEAAAALGAGELLRKLPFERVTCQEAFVRWAGFDPLPLSAESLRAAAGAAGVRVGATASWDDAFTQVLLERVEPALGRERPAYLTSYPASQAALSKLHAHDPRVAERFELYAGGLELANGFSELTDAAEQRARLQAEQAERARLSRTVFGLDEAFLAALPRISSAGGVAVGVDRLLMLLTGKSRIEDVLLFPAAEEYAAAEPARDE